MPREQRIEYLMTFQNLLACLKWNNEGIEEECKRIIEKSGCNYLEDLSTCVAVNENTDMYTWK